MPRNKELLCNWGENTAYSSKCHFKMSDINWYLIYFLIVINIVFAVLSILDMGELLVKVFAVMSLVASIIILIHKSQISNRSILTHKEIGEFYLALHYDIQALYFQNEVNDKDLSRIKEQVKDLNLKPKPSVNFIAKRWATCAIEDKGEMLKWWKK
jgi:hypothetical protein